MADTHSVMPKKLAQALIEAGITHFDSGGTTQPVPDAGASLGNTVGSIYSGDFGGAVSGVGDTAKGIAGAFTSQNQYQAQAPPIANQNFAPQIGRMQTQQQQTYDQQQNLAQTLLDQSQGRGPNPAQMQFNQNTGQNVAQQGALMAGQRGAGANVGMMARQAAQQGANTQQQAAGQAATLQAQQQLAAQGQLGQTYGNMANQSLQGESIQQGGQAAQNTAITSGSLGAQNINANIAGQNAAALNGSTGSLLNSVGAGMASKLAQGGVVQRMDTGGMANYAAPNVAPISMTDWQNQGLQLTPPKKEDKKKPGDPASTSGTDQGGNDGMAMAGGPGDAGSIDPTTMLAARGGRVPRYDEGGDVGGPEPLMGIEDFSPKSSGGGGGGGEVTNPGVSVGGGGGGGGGGGSIMSMLPMLAMLKGGGKIPFSRALLDGGNVKGKAQTKGDSAKNDNQPALLSPGEIVLPRSVTQGGNTLKKEVEFLKHLQSKKSGGYSEVAGAKKSLEQRVKHLEKLCMGGKA